MIIPKLGFVTKASKISQPAKSIVKTTVDVRFNDIFSSHFIAIAEVYKNEGNEAYLKEDYVNAVYFYTEGIKVNCKDQELKGKLYSNRAYANLRLGKCICKLQRMVRQREIRTCWV